MVLKITKVFIYTLLNRVKVRDLDDLWSSRSSCVDDLGFKTMGWIQNKVIQICQRATKQTTGRRAGPMTEIRLGITASPDN